MDLMSGFRLSQEASDPIPIDPDSESEPFRFVSGSTSLGECSDSRFVPHQGCT